MREPMSYLRLVQPGKRQGGRVSYLLKTICGYAVHTVFFGTLPNFFLEHLYVADPAITQQSIGR